MARLKELYETKLRKEIAESLKISNIMAVPKISKVVINAGVGRAVADSKKIEEAEAAITAICGQKPVQTKAKKSIAGFKLREGMPVGVSVTLRGNECMNLLID